MLKIDKCSDDQERNENPVHNRHLPREALPDREKKKRGEQFDGEIAKSDFCAAIRASAAKREPTDQRQILIPRNRLFAGRTKRAARPIDRKIDRPAVNADVEERTDRRAEHEGEHAKEKI